MARQNIYLTNVYDGVDGHMSVKCYDLDPPSFLFQTLRTTNSKGEIGCQNTRFKAKRKCLNLLRDRLEKSTALQTWAEQETGRDNAQIQIFPLSTAKLKYQWKDPSFKCIPPMNKEMLISQKKQGNVKNSIH